MFSFFGWQNILTHSPLCYGSSLVWSHVIYPKYFDFLQTFLPTDWCHCIMLTHWGRVTHICVSKLTIIGSDNGLLPGGRQVIIWTNDGILLIGTLETNFREILSKIHIFSLKKVPLKLSSAKWQPFCICLNVSSNDDYYAWFFIPFYENNK